MSRSTVQPTPTTHQGTAVRGGALAWWVRSAVEGAALAFLAFQVTLLVITIATSVVFSGYNTVLTSGSMEPKISRGDVVVMTPLDQAPVLGEIVAFEGELNLVTHRIVEIDGERIVTKGDANRRADSTIRSPEDLVGTARVIIPLIGAPRMWVHEQAWDKLAIWSAIVLFALIISRPRRDPDSSATVDLTDPATEVSP